MWGDTNELEKKVRDAGGEMDAPGGGKYRFVGEQLYLYSPQEIEEEKQSKLKTQALEESQQRGKSAVDAIAQTSPGYQWSPEKPETVVAGMNDEALQREKALTAEMPIGGFNEATKKTDYLDAIARVANKPRSDIMPKALDKFSAANQQLAQYGDTEPVKNYLDNIKSEATMEQKRDKIGGIGASSLAGSDDPEFISKITDQVDEYEAKGILTPLEAKTQRILAVKKPTVVADYLGSLTKPKTQKEQASGIDVKLEGDKTEERRRREASTETDINAQAIPGFKPIKNAMITDESVQKVKSIAPDIETMKELADELITKYDKMGSVFTGNDAADYSSKVRNLQLLAKSPALYNLGVLTGPDLALLEQSIPNPASIKEGVKKQALGDLSVKLNNFRGLIDKRGSMFYRMNGFEKEAKKTTGTTTNSANSPAKSYLEEIRALRATRQGQ